MQCVVTECSVGSPGAMNVDSLDEGAIQVPAQILHSSEVHLPFPSECHVVAQDICRILMMIMY